MGRSPEELGSRQGALTVAQETGVPMIDLQGTGPGQPTNEARLHVAIEAAVAGDRHALSYLWVRFADDVLLALLADGIAHGEASAMTMNAFVPAVVANCRDRREVLQCLFNGAQGLAQQT